ncbi:unnamed protein product [Amoebophrya sp. A25]|nr:unnamed protein product [Amoebophrya sp. A25]|eukprot:GSA25T00014021001.1
MVLDPLGRRRDVIAARARASAWLCSIALESSGVFLPSDPAFFLFAVVCLSLPVFLWLWRWQRLPSASYARLWARNSTGFAYFTTVWQPSGLQLPLQTFTNFQQIH